ncbi:precorrin-6A synthase (deacetylating) [Patulibacter minatonensis]|uniref:precorrin-6A synthase (deacetylating) n=1 Tax=Patulibacter minatonensis TaxID=298163 RepID=UPI0004793965|nr:precorrin-6A synthase (deacetylating) [Patulibacter minatonensis]
MPRLLIIGIGVGDPDHVTVQAVRALNDFDVLFVVTKPGVDEPLALRRTVVDRHRAAGAYRTVELPDPPRERELDGDHGSAVRQWRRERADLWTAALDEHLGADETGAFLVWGDPSLYESTLAIAQTVVTRTAVPVEVEVLPGVSAVHVLTARHRIPLNRVGRAVQITPARLLADGMPEDVDDVVVMLDAHATFASIPADGLEIYWGAYLGTEDELLRSGPLGEVAEEIRALRAEAKARKGWMFDTYLLRRTG